MIDDGDTEISALNAIFSSAGIQILICQWHITRAWQKNVRSKVIYNFTRNPFLPELIVSASHYVNF